MIQLVGKKVTFETPFELEGKPLVLHFRLPKPEIWAELQAKWPIGDEVTKEVDGKEVKVWESRDWTDGDNTIKTHAWALKTKDFIKERLKEYWIEDNKIAFEDFVEAVWASDNGGAMNLMQTLRDKFSSSFRELGKNP